MEEIIAHKVEGVETLDPEGVEAMLETVADAADAFEISGGQEIILIVFVHSNDGIFR